MIENATLFEFDKGRAVWYVPPQANGDRTHPDVVKGHLYDWDDTTATISLGIGADKKSIHNQSELVWGETPKPYELLY